MREAASERRGMSARRATAGSRALAHRLPRHLGVRRRESCERLAGGEHRPALVDHPPRPPAGTGSPCLLRHRWRASRSRARCALAQPASVNDEETRERIARGASRGDRGVRLRRAHQGAAALRARAAERASRRCFRAGAARRRSSARSWPATRETGRVDHAPDRGPGQRPGVPRGRPRSRPTTTTARWRRAWRARWRGAREVLDALARGEALHWIEQDDEQATYAAKLEPDDRLLDPERPAAELERVVRALHPHIGARVALADGEMLGVERAALYEAPGGGAGARWRPCARRAPSAGRQRRRARAARGQAARRPADGRRRLPARPSASPPAERACHGQRARSGRTAPARRCAYLVLRRVFERGAYADRALSRRGARSSSARDRGARDAPRLWRRAAPGNARPPDRGSSPSVRSGVSTRRCGRR